MSLSYGDMCANSDIQTSAHKQYVVKRGSTEVAFFRNPNAAKIRMRELGGMHFVYDRWGRKIIAFPDD